MKNAYYHKLKLYYNTDTFIIITRNMSFCLKKKIKLPPSQWLMTYSIIFRHGAYSVKKNLFLTISNDK